MTLNDASWRLLQFEIHHTDPAIERLACHLPFDNSVVFTQDDNLEQVLENPRNKISKLTAQFEANKTFPDANQFTYVESPEHFTWHRNGNTRITTMAIRKRLAEWHMLALTKGTPITFVCFYIQ